MSDILFTRGGRENQSEAEEIPLGSVLDLLRDRRRRLALSYLRGTDIDPVPVDRLTAAVTAMVEPVEPDVDPTAISTSLYHSHLPRLEDVGVVDYDLDEGLVSYNSHDRVEKFLDVAAEEDPLL